MADIMKDTQEKIQAPSLEWWETRGKLWKLAVAVTVATALHSGGVLAGPEAPTVNPGQTVTQNLSDGRTVTVSSGSDVRTVVFNGQVRVIIDGVVQPIGTKIPENKPSSTSANIIDRTVDLRGKSTPQSPVQIESTNTQVSQTIDTKPGEKEDTKKEKSVTVTLNEKKDGIVLSGKTGGKMEISFAKMKAMSLPEQSTLLGMFGDDQKRAYQAYIMSLAEPASVDPINTHLASNGESLEKLAKLSPEEMRKLPFSIRMEVKKWQSAQLHKEAVAITQENEKKREILTSLTQENAKTRERIAILDQDIEAEKKKLWELTAQVIPGLLAEAKAGNTIIVSKLMKENIRLMADGKLPPPEMQASARELLRYMN